MDMENLTEKEFSKLKRRDLLELLVSQIQEDDRLERRGAVMAARINKQEKSLIRLKERLDEKDTQIERLKTKLDDKDREIAALRDTLHRERTSRRIELDEAGSIAEAALRLSGIFEAAQDAADRYLENIKRFRTSTEEESGTGAAEACILGDRPGPERACREVVTDGQG